MSFPSALITEPSVAPNANLPSHHASKTHPPGIDYTDSVPDPVSEQPLICANASSKPSYIPALRPRPYSFQPGLPYHQVIVLHTKLQRASGPNSTTLRLPVPSKLNNPEWSLVARLRDYQDRYPSAFLEFGWLTGHASTHHTPASTHTNHGSAWRTHKSSLPFFPSSANSGLHAVRLLPTILPRSYWLLIHFKSPAAARQNRAWLLI